MKKNGKYIGNIYLITCLVNNKYYVGQTRNEIYDRWSGHKHDAKRKENPTAIEKAINKYGEDSFKVELLEKIIADSFDELNNLLNEKEIYYINEYHSLTHENGYNITPGGNSVGAAQKKKTYCFTTDGDLVAIFESRAEAGRFINKPSGDISNAITRKGLCHGYYFSNDPIFDYEPPTTYMNTKVYAYDYNGKLEDIYENYKDASIKTGVDASGIFSSCTGVFKSAKGRIYRFEYDSFDKYPLPVKGRFVNLYMNNIYIKTFDTIKNCAKEIMANPSNVSAVLSSKFKNSKTVKGYTVFYASDPNQPDKTKIIK